MLICVCCVFQPAFGCCAHPKAGRNTFFQPFLSFFVHFKPFSVYFYQLLGAQSTRKLVKIHNMCYCNLVQTHLRLHLYTLGSVYKAVTLTAHLSSINPVLVLHQGLASHINIVWAYLQAYTTPMLWKNLMN